jgi:hypothetical protein
VDEQGTVSRDKNGSDITDIVFVFIFMSGFGFEYE